MAPTILCLASYFKGGAFLEECKRLGCHTILITSQDLEHEAWPREAIDEFFVMPFANLFKQPDITNAVSFLARNRKIDRIIALDDFDVETVADLREHLRMPGMGGSTARYFRDKLAMRVQARDEGIPVPEFVHVLNYDDVRDYMHRVPGPWVLKPRSEASSMGIRKVNSAEELWPILDELGDRQSFYVLEKFVPGDVFHVDSVVWNKKVLFTVCSKYGLPPMAVYQGGGVFITGNLPYHAPEEQALQALNREVIAAMGMVRGVTHAEFIRAEADGTFHFLEIAARVGGANIDLMLEHATGINLWREWARLELAHLNKQEYELPPTHQEYAGLVVSLARQPWP
ncbi:MAG: ATP-grasp domain-containing protein, partial [Caldilineaceae bacterium]|nr:ATP-grasp domain-containing protein [Caldilineaceae bacterium]